ncbi:hypothetical protein ACJMK2_035556 [Sinanodonta woodiana]|uniref:Uncharacterized protein n=1 Tax=Sinanodonta woodiana TaxID=1069815 RepID=A0ABD3WVA5_SINWO
MDQNSNELNITGVRTFNTRDKDVFLLPHHAVLEVQGQILQTLKNLVYLPQLILARQMHETRFQRRVIILEHHHQKQQQLIQLF